MRHRIAALAVAAAVTAVVAGVVRAHVEPAPVEKEILDLVQQEWAAEAKKDLAAMVKSKSKDLTMFDFGNPYRTDYATDNDVIRAGFTHDKNAGMVSQHMVHPKVQVYGDTAILTYHFVGQLKSGDGKLSNLYSRATRVYVKQGGQWMWVHGHFSRASAE